MKIIEVDEELYQYIASQTRSIGESASDILRRLLSLPVHTSIVNDLIITSAETDQKPKQAINVKEVNIKTTKKQSITAINQIVEKVQTLLNSTEFQEESKAVVRFLAILRVLYRTNPEGFAQATESLQGRTRVYFARDEATLLMAGNHTKPKQIPDTPYWVITNTNSGRKMLMLEGAMQSMELPETLIDEVRSYFTVN
ncbi:replication initiation regulator SeqA [Haemophilus influenzae biotype aegyptius]|uniref:replication initiation negative regulator SeqA n=1 Tax=Haemophilus influenzae TaxID=727 RepID=UPI0001F3693F|nr:replication initiation negative regulator SeqA [Haemophilus influenzae]QEQ62049.1 replication initiation negative regulator SeqA [Haemophilus influenzae biotype aegyptius]QEQ64240.1 replication initiation negative regulator SeqA [Haemophilus influenzae biotype aegyptius]QEQ65610.1 replication initiation negative regulator SeqA [Haemophilus influenzae biotype aegyptius]TMQ37332.1 replication initiation regulator SeqA [Haemophilus influenzae biotype aegyptius]TMQ37504.1 replication initiation